MKRLPVTCATGLVASHRLCSLRLQDHKVTVLEDLSTRSKTNEPRQQPGLELVHLDAGRSREGPVDPIYHPACAASPPKCG